MSNIQQSLDRALNKAIGLLYRVGIPSERVMEFEKLAMQVYEPCIIAVVGQVKAGKSSFVNALLNADLAKVDMKEATATINQFRYGKIANDEPIRVVWKTPGKEPTFEKVDFLNNLQGYTNDVISQADSIDHLEYFLQNPYLEQITLVDTPGTQSAIEEHQERGDTWMRLSERLSKETKTLSETADAVIFLMETVALKDDQQYLENYKRISQANTRSFNTIGVLSKVDQDPAITESRVTLEKRSKSIATSFNEYLNAVVPVSAGVQRTLDKLLENNQSGLQLMMDTFHSLPKDVLEELFSDKKSYLSMSIETFPVEERQQLLNHIAAGNFEVFITLMRVIMKHERTQRDAVKEQLAAIANFDQLRETLNFHILARKQSLRCFRLIEDARHILNDIQTYVQVDMRKRDDENQQKLVQLCEALPSSVHDDVLIQEIKVCIQKQLAPKVGEINEVIKQIEQDFDDVFHELKEYNDDFMAFKRVMDQVATDQASNQHRVFSEAEVEELRALFGIVGLETKIRLSIGEMSAKYVRRRMRAWQDAKQSANYVRRTIVAPQAFDRYTLILKELKASGLL